MQQLLFKVFDELGDNHGWSAEFHVRFQWLKTRIRPDIIINKDGRIVIVCEIGTSVLSDAYTNTKEKAKRYCEILQCPYYLAITNDKFGLFDKDNDRIKSEERLIDANDIKIVLEDLESDKKQEFKHEEWNRQIEDLIEYINSIEDPNIDKEGIKESVRDLSNSRIIHSEDKQIGFTPQTEDDFIQKLLPQLKHDKLCRFSSFNSLFRTINLKNHSMCSIIAMNDKSETSYVSDYFNEHGGSYPGASYLKTPENWNTCFITSCCDIDRSEDFTMMRLYGDDAKGVIYKYGIDANRIKNGFFLKPVSYQRNDGSHPELDIIQKLLAINVNGYVVTLQHLSVWQHFFKLKEYAFEEEVRLLYKLPDNEEHPNSKIIWVLNSEFNVITPIITFPITDSNKILPLVMEGVTLGPKLKERDDNLLQIKYLMNLNKIENHDNINILLSSINHYRT